MSNRLVQHCITFKDKIQFEIVYENAVWSCIYVLYCIAVYQDSYRAIQVM